MKVLIGIDGSKEAVAALLAADRFLIPAGRNLDLLCVAPKLRRCARSQSSRKDYERSALGEMTRFLEQARASLPPNRGVVQLIAETGSPSASLVSRAADYDLTVIGPKGRGAAGNLGLGPVASRVVEHALGPVLIARELRGEGDIRVLAAVDGSVASVRAVETLGSLFDLSSAEVCLMHVAETPWIELGLEEDWVTSSEDEKEHSEAGILEKELVREGAAVIEQARDLLPRAASVTTRIDEGNPADLILSEAERGQYDLIVAGATGSRDLKHSMLGSVSSKLAWNAPCSVLIVREPE